MGVQEIIGKGKEGIPEYPNKRRSGQTAGFQESLMQNLKYREQENAADAAETARKSAAADAAETTRKAASAESAETAWQGAASTEYAAESAETLRKSAAAESDTRAGIGVTAGTARIRVNETMRRAAVQPAEVRRMSYEESDNIEIAVTEGYTLKGKLEGRQVYVEAKYEDGRIEACYVDTDKVQQQTQHRIEQFALETAQEHISN